MTSFRVAPGGGRAFLGSPGTLAFVASEGAEIFGWCWGYHLVRPDASSMLYLHRLEVAHEHRRRGIGRALLRAFMTAGAQAGAGRMFLTTGEANAPARALYESLGGGLAAQGPTVSYWFPLPPGSAGVQSPGCRALLLTGVAGVGKSTVADAVGRVLTGAGHVTAVVDTDLLAQFGPPPGVSPAGAGFYDELKCVNLASVWANFRAAGARFVVAAAVIDSVAQRERYSQSLAGCDVRVVRLTADVDTVRDRLRRRDTGPELERHLRALDRHESSPAEGAIEDCTVTNDRTPAEVAAEVLVRVGWADQVSFRRV
ncbi:GNAT family N-acetyltransferase [Dactylosporangium sp. NPDC000521]|uniref:GNAT family N-acetyltransferase n=1 Tax=Dactylosporangium sp. NPDC000521 TaxID=3363975 RepID=UPI0036C8958E